MPEERPDKPWYASKGIMGSLLAGIASIVVFWNAVTPNALDIPPEIQNQINSESTLTAIAAIGGLVASILSWIGRVAAKKPIRKSVL